MHTMHQPRCAAQSWWSFRLPVLGKKITYMQVFILGKNELVFECPSNCLVDALFYLHCCYYVIDVSYPSSLEGILFFLQDLAREPFSLRQIYNCFLVELKDFSSRHS